MRTILLLLCGALGCSDAPDERVNPEGQNRKVLLVSNIESAGVCSGEKIDVLIYVTSERSFYACGREGWKKLAQDVSLGEGYDGGMLNLMARRTYDPPNQQDAETSFSTPITFKLPSVVQVLAGNAGNHSLIFRYDEVTCIYKGGATTPTPLNPFDAEQAYLGSKYHFASCKSGAKAGKAIQAQNFSLRIDYGDSTTPTEVLFLAQLQPLGDD